MNLIGSNNNLSLRKTHFYTKVIWRSFLNAHLGY